LAVVGNAIIQVVERVLDSIDGRLPLWKVEHMYPISRGHDGDTNQSLFMYRQMSRHDMSPVDLFLGKCHDMT
jgi:hypothetical protein